MTERAQPLTVAKIGGSAVDAGGPALWSALSFAASAGPTVVVHGGGSTVDRRLGAHGFISERVGGLRLTPSEHMGIVAGALAGEVNTRIVASLRAAGAPAVGLTLVDAGVSSINAGLGDGDRVGRVEPGGAIGPLIGTLIDGGFVPVVASVGADGDGLLNINADDAAEGVAVLLGASKLVLLSDVAGVLNGAGDVIASMDDGSVDGLVRTGVVTAGMEAKVRAAIRASCALGGPVVIASWTDAAAVLAGELGIGTTVRGTLGPVGSAGRVGSTGDVL